MLRLPLSIVALAVAGLLWPRGAGAHAILVDSQPAAQAVVPPGPAKFRFRFNSRVDHLRSRLVLRAGQGETALSIDSISDMDVPAASATLAPGDYTMRWLVLAVDGHITRGDLPFSVRAP